MVLMLRYIERGDLEVGLALGDEGEDLGLAVAETLATPRPVASGGCPRAWRGLADDQLTGRDRFDPRDEVPRRECLGEVAACALGQGAVDERRVEVPCVHGDVAGVRVGHEDGNVVVVSLRLGEGVVQDHIDVIAHGLVGVELGDDDAVTVGIEEVGQPDHDDVVVVDQGDPQRSGRSVHTTDRKSSVGVYTTARRGGYLGTDRKSAITDLLGGLVATLLWILAVVLVIAGIVTAIRGQLLLGIVLIIVGLCVGPGGVSLFT